VAPRRLNGWEPAETTKYIFAKPIWWKPWTWRKVIGTTTTRESEFDDEQRELLLASAAFEASIGTNGHLNAEAMSPEASPTNYDSSLRFSANGPFWDYAEKARLDDIDRYRAEFPKDSPPNLNGAFWTVEKHGELSGDAGNQRGDSDDGSDN